MKTYKNIEILLEKPHLSDSEIDSYMDFDSLLVEYNRTKEIKKRNVKRNLLFALLVMLTSISGYYISGQFLAKESIGSLNENIPPNGGQLMDSTVNINTIDVTDLPDYKNTVDIGKRAISKKEDSISLIKTGRALIEKEAVQKSQKNKVADSNANIIEQPPVYIKAIPLEGYPILYAFLKENLIYPDHLRKDSIEGVVLVNFLILKDSSISSVEIIESLGVEFDNEALRVINLMPKWIPATVNNNPIHSKVSIPLSFSIIKTVRK